MTQARARDNVADKNALLRFLHDNEADQFAAADLTQRTGVPKMHVRGHLSGEPNIETLKYRGKTFYQFKSPQR